MILSNRTMSSFPLSIGTGIAFEALFDSRTDPYDNTRELPKRVNINNYNELFINITTLYRNLLGSIPKEEVSKLKESEVIDTLQSEVEVINSLLLNEGRGTCKTIYYIPTYKSLYKKENILIKFRMPSTEGQKAAILAQNKLMNSYLKEDKNVIKLDSEITSPKNKSSSLILTHIPYDLTSNIHFNKLSLLESHTGKVKDKKDLYTKYYPVGDRDMNNIPFLRKLLFILGDRIQIQPIDIKTRRMVLDLASEYKWTVMTTLDRVNLTFETGIKDPYARKMLGQL